MVNSNYFAEEEIKYACRKDELPESDEMETERNAFEVYISFDSAKNPFGCVVRRKDRNYT